MPRMPGSTDGRESGAELRRERGEQRRRGGSSSASRRAEAHAHGAAAHDRAGRRLLRDRAAAARNLERDAEAGELAAHLVRREAAEVRQQHAVVASLWLRSAAPRCARRFAPLAAGPEARGCSRLRLAAVRSRRRRSPSSAPRRCGGAASTTFHGGTQSARAHSGSGSSGSVRMPSRASATAATRANERRRGGAAGVHEAARLVDHRGDHEARRVGGRRARRTRPGSDARE